jgi:hypothetical protein
MVIKKQFADKFKPFIRPFLILCVIYLIAYFAILRSNVYYLDDNARVAGGYFDWENFSRHISNLVMGLVNFGNTALTDIAPIPQLLTIALLSITALCAIYILNNGKITLPALIASLPLGLSPWFLECISYRFDSLTMAISVACMVIPFLWFKRRIPFMIVTFVCVLVMLMTYQAASGIFFCMGIMTAFVLWQRLEITAKSIYVRVGLALSGYIAAVVVFRFFFYTEVLSYVTTTIFPLQDMSIGVIHNLKQYVETVLRDMTFLWKVFATLIAVACAINCLITTKRSRITTLIVGIVLTPVLLIAVFGQYLLLTAPLFDLRALFSFGALISFIGIFTCYNINQKVALNALFIPGLLLSLNLIVFSNVYGNALAEQFRYNNLIDAGLAADINRTYPELNAQPVPLKYGVQGTAGKSPLVVNAIQPYPVIARLVPSERGSGWVWYWYSFTAHNDLNLIYDYAIREEDLELSMDLDTARYTILSGDGVIFVRFK